MPKPTEDELMNLDAINRVMNEIVPFNKLIGLNCVELKRGFAKAEVPFKDDLVGDVTRPAIHGGVLATVADAVCGAAVFTMLRPGDTCSTIDLRIDYLRPGLSQTIFAEGEVLRIGGQVAVAQGRLYQENGENIAVSKGVFMIRRRQDRDDDDSTLIK
jgi:uncharacterized protein (TIGR00369 family)